LKTGSHSFLARRAKAVSLLGDFRGRRLLDIGCGTGALMEYVARDAEYFGIDNATKMVEQARRHAAELAFAKRCIVRTGDAQALPFEADYFDAVVGLGLIEYFDEPEKVVSEAIRVAKPGGRLVFSIPLRYSVDRFMVWSSTPLRAIGRKLTGTSPDIKHGMYAKAEFRRLFTRFGCTVLGEAVYNKQVLPYPFSRLMPEAAGKAAAMVEDRRGLGIFATGYVLACQKR
jgi:ubiquinone/menaquinone biosynthesis C-methylase UbiE